jgi:AcrR family transcriptional regulator
MAGRPREFDRDDALERMQATFWAHGYEGASMADLVDATGLASARLYAAFGSKEAMFRAAIERYEREEGGFADRALAEEPTVRRAFERMLREAVDVYTDPHPRGCMVVSAAATYSVANDRVRDWLERHRRGRTDSIVERVRTAVADGELPPATDAQALGDAVAALLHGLSVQARDGVPRHRLLAMIPLALSLFGPPAGRAR